MPDRINRIVRLIIKYYGLTDEQKAAITQTLQYEIGAWEGEDPTNPNVFVNSYNASSEQEIVELVSADMATCRQSVGLDVDHPAALFGLSISPVVIG